MRTRTKITLTTLTATLMSLSVTTATAGRLSTSANGGQASLNGVPTKSPKRRPVGSSTVLMAPVAVLRTMLPRRFSSGLPLSEYRQLPVMPRMVALIR
jgi:hypothetical protein